ncbi:MAG TPA: hypothetical protein VNO26_10515 [Candidatus Limnocylindria bacterium]|nr:hypothetical protein [Candidatus Limnocylindria bacterium]
MIGNPTTPAAGQTLTLQATNTADGESAVTTSAPYAVTASTTCAPELDFYVRDWTTNAASHDVGNEPSNGPDWALTSDVWNQYTNTALPLVNDWVPGKYPTNTGSNFAFARISRKTTNSAPAFGRTVRAEFFAAPFGAGPQFGSIGPTTVDLQHDSPNTFVNIPWNPGSLPIVVGNHLCLAVEIDSPSDPVVKTPGQESIAGDVPDAASADRIMRNNNQAQRNLELVSMPKDFPIPPPPPPPGDGGMGGMRHFAVIHNAAIETRDLTLRGIDAVVATFRKGELSRDAVGIDPALAALHAALDARDPGAAAVSHLALLERLDGAQTMVLLAHGNPLDIVQMVRWQHALYTTRPVLTAIPAGAAVAKRADDFLRTAVASKPDGKRYARLIGESMRDFRATTEALRKQGIHLTPELAELEKRAGAGPAALEKAHRAFLLALDDSSGDRYAKKR